MRRHLWQWREPPRWASASPRPRSECTTWPAASSPPWDTWQIRLTKILVLWRAFSTGRALKCRCSEYLLSINKLFKWLFSRVLTSNRGGPGFNSRPGHASPGTSLGWRWPWSSLFMVVTPTWSVLFDSQHADLQVLMSWQLAVALLMPCKCYSAYILMQFMCVHVCSCNTCTGVEPCTGHSPLVAHSYVL